MLIIIAATLMTLATATDQVTPPDEEMTPFVKICLHPEIFLEKQKVEVCPFTDIIMFKKYGTRQFLTFKMSTTEITQNEPIDLRVNINFTENSDWECFKLGHGKTKDAFADLLDYAHVKFHL